MKAETKSCGEKVAEALRALADALEHAESLRLREPPQCAPAFANERETLRISGLTRAELYGAVNERIVGFKKNGESGGGGARRYRVADAIRLADSRCVGGKSDCE